MHILTKLAMTPQSPVHHPEGSVLSHTLMVVEKAKENIDKAKYPFGFMLAALCHDFGKPQATKWSTQKNDWTAYDHDVLGVEPTQDFVSKITKDPYTIAYVCNMVALHMKPVMYSRNGAKEKKWFKLFASSICPQDLLLLSECDFLGRLAIRDFSPIKGTMYSMLEAWRRTK